MWLRDLVDGLLELSVVGSFSRPGYRLRRRLFGWSAPSSGSLDGKTVLITGPTSGLGRATADAVAALGARVILVGRDRERLARVRDELVAAHGEDRFPVILADMSSLSSVRVAVELIRRDEPRLDVLVDNGTRRGETHGIGRTRVCLSQIMAYCFARSREVCAL